MYIHACIHTCIHRCCSCNIAMRALPEKPKCSVLQVLCNTYQANSLKTAWKLFALEDQSPKPTLLHLQDPLYMLAFYKFWLWVSSCYVLATFSSFSCVLCEVVSSCVIVLPSQHEVMFATTFVLFLQCKRWRHKLKCYWAVCCGCNLVNNGLKGCQSHNEIIEMDRPLTCKCAWEEDRKQNLFGVA